MGKRSSGYYSIDADFNILSFNKTAKDIYPMLQVGRKCHKVLFGTDTPCPFCPIVQGIHGPNVYLDPIRNIYQSVDAVEVDMPDGTTGHTMVFSNVDEEERQSGSIPTDEKSLRLLYAINLTTPKYSFIFSVDMQTRRISVFRSVKRDGTQIPVLADNMAYGDAVELLLAQYIPEEYHASLKAQLAFEQVQARLSGDSSFVLHCKVMLEKIHYYALRIARNGDAESFREFVFAIVCEDDQVHSKQIYDSQISALLSSVSHTPGWAHMDITEDRIIRFGGDSLLMASLGPSVNIRHLIHRQAAYMPDEADRENFLRVFDPEAIQQAYDAGKVEVVYEPRCIFCDQVIRWVRYTLRLIANPVSNHLEAVLYGENVTCERMHIRTQEGIVQTLCSKYLDAFLINMQERTATMIKRDGDPDTRLDENAKVFPFDALADQYIRAFVHPDDRQMMRDALDLDHVAENLRRNHELTYNYRVLYHGQTHYYQTRFIKNDHYDIVVMGSLSVDDVVAAELELQNKLQAALEAANRANMEKSRFLSRMSHDMRTPLNGILGILEMGRKHEDDIEYLKENRRKAFIATNHLISLVNDVLDMAKIEAGGIVLAHEPFDICEKCNEAMALLLPQAQEQGINFTMNFAPQEERLTYLCGSPLHLCRAMMNIIGNCIKYNKENGSVHMDVQIIAYDEKTATYRWTITDTGIGMSGEFLKHIFDPFSQASTDVKSVFQGTGLGMSIAKGLIEQMGGTLEVTSRLGVGSTFVITIPFELADSSQIVRAENAQDVSIAGMRILVAEDNELNREIAEVLLQEEGAVVTTVVNGKEAVEAVANNPPGTFDLVLMDVMMPVMGGYESAMTIREMERADTKTLPIVAMTANAFADDVQKSLNAGMNAHISKPLNLSNLLRTLAQYKT